MLFYIVRVFFTSEKEFVVKADSSAEAKIEACEKAYFAGIGSFTEGDIETEVVAIGITEGAAYDTKDAAYDTR